MKKRIKGYITFLFIQFFCLNLSSQIGPIVNTVIPPSPTSAVFRQFAGYTPDLATGSINIPIDLYNIQVGDFSIPITLQYYTSGIKITDDPYPAGYGWILSPGLRITRTIMGRPDMYFPLEVRDQDIDFNYCKKSVYDYEAIHKHTGWSRDILIDTQHDIFTVHLPHGNYTFFVNKEGDEYVAVTSNNNLKIIPQGLLAFEVIDEQGVTYYFGQQDNYLNSPYTEFYNNFSTSWMLRKIVLPGKDNEINFTWKKVRHSELRYEPIFQGDVLEDYKERYNMYAPVNNNPEYTSAEAVGLFVKYGEYNEVLQLDQIIFPTGKVEFSYKSVSKPLITGIKVSNSNNLITKTIDFSYGSGFDERLLQNINISGEGIYRFEYNPNHFDGRNVYSQDYWGYYNAKNNTSLVPRMQIKTYNNRLNENAWSYEFYGTADRSVNSEAMKACVLTKVIYPTGGYSIFEYEPHQFQGSIPQTEGLGTTSKIQLTVGGGLRVSKVVSSSGELSPEIVKKYKYGENENGLANIIYEPTLDTFIDELSGYDGDVVDPGSMIGYNVRLLFLNTQSNYMRYAINTPSLWYNVITEYTNDSSKTTYNYKRHAPENVFSPLNTIKDFPYQSIVNYNNLFSKGCLLIKKTHYQKSGSTYIPIKQTTYNYTLKNPYMPTINNLVINRVGISRFDNGPDFYYAGSILYSEKYSIYGWPIAYHYMHNPCSIRAYYEELTDEETISYTPFGNVFERTNYTYTGLYLSSKTILRSGGYAQTENYLYPQDYAQAETQSQKVILSDMLTNNIKAPIVKVTKIINGSVEQMRHEYKNYGYNLYLPEKSFYKKGNEPEICKYVYDYDIKGNLQCYIQNGSTKQTYLWGYNYSYPVAIIDGLNYSETLALAGQSNITDLNSYTWNIPSVLNKIRAGVSGPGLMTSYIYEPLVGITSTTAPNGKTTYYSYDNVGRLMQVKDNSSKKNQNFAYHRNTDALNLSFSIQFSYDYGSSLNTTAKASGGSEWYSYIWTLKNSSGTTVYSSSASESPTVSILLQQIGSLTLTCTVTDKMTNESKSSSQTFAVSSPTIKFTDIKQANGTVTANIDCVGACTIDFYLMVEMTSDSYATYSLDGQVYTLYAADGISVPMTLSAGTHTFTVSITASDTGNKAGLYITAGGNGSPSSIETFN